MQRQLCHSTHRAPTWFPGQHSMPLKGNFTGLHGCHL
uniref:Uncharacterized protein n=1 Tax=Anguilla anguilla TaxID=7936 RepID=A0A0E9UGL6_ANGAN